MTLRPPRALVVASALALAPSGCRSQPDDGPVAVVKRFIAVMEEANRFPDARADAFALLDRDSRIALAERAHQATALGGRELTPWEMIVEGRFRLNFQPRRGRAGFREVRDPQHPDRATVVVRGPGDRSAEVPLVREEGRWRILLGVPRRVRRPAREEHGAGAPEGRLRGPEGPPKVEDDR
ncbi:MAG: hypothetical protein ACFCGT_11665 [Sandaracinaceae bacterium]